MPALDQCEPQVIRALRKDGWVVKRRPYALRVDKARASYVFADLLLQDAQTQQTIIVVEVKCFSGTVPLLEEFYHAIGQYAVYRNALTYSNIDAPLYLTVPSQVYDSFFQRPVIRLTVADIQVKMIVIDLESEEVVAWIT